MNRVTYLLIAFTLLLNACTSENVNESDIVDPASLNSEYTGIQKEIAAHILASRFGGYRNTENITRATNKFSLSPYILNGDTLLYVAQYENGWEIYSASKCANMILFSSEEGKFDINSFQCPESLRFLINENAKEIREISRKRPGYIHPSWKNSELLDKDVLKEEVFAKEKDNGRFKVNESELPPGKWVQIGYEIVDRKTNTSPKLIKTKWGQSSPWNAYAKYGLSIETGEKVQCVAGCTPVAVAQYEYFTHFKDGIPEKAPSNARILSTGNSDFIFIDYSSEVWSKMAKYYVESGTKESALLIGKTGRSLGSTYTIKSTSTSEAKCIKFLTDTYGIQFKREPFDYIKMLKSLRDQGYPLIAYAASNNKSDGSTLEKTVAHSFIIDQYRENTVTYRYVYGLERDPLPSGSDDRWMADIKDSNGNIIQYAYTKEIYSTFVESRAVSMNWGWEGYYDGTFYSSSNWDAGGYRFNLEQYVYARGE